MRHLIIGVTETKVDRLETLGGLLKQRFPTHEVTVIGGCTALLAVDDDQAPEITLQITDMATCRAAAEDLT